MYLPSNSICSILPYKWSNDWPQIVFAVGTCTVYASQTAAHAPFHTSQLAAEVLAAPDDDDNSPFLTWDHNEDKLEANELSVYCP